jgi:hypothetical protein
VLIRSAALALALAGPAAAQDYNQPDIVRGLCQKHGCDEFRVLSAEPVTSTDEGRLLRTRIQTFHASSRGRANQKEENGYVFCSPTRPAIMAEQNGQTMAFFLAPFATQESRESVRQNANFHALYFAICHGREAGKAAVHNLAGVAQSHGYRVALAQSKLMPLRRAEDVLTMAGDPNERVPVEARRDAHPERSPAEAQRYERRDRAPIEVRPEERLEHPGEARRYGGLDRAPQDARRYERWDRGPEEAMRRERPEYREPWRQASPRVAEEDRDDEGMFSGVRRLTNRAFDALDEAGDWVIGKERN